ncbi:MAG: S-layer homology domain-containing protein [Clostridia bacterium]|nr:S-layer homology domain-containing protein [Clostridia bacterium]
MRMLKKLTAVILSAVLLLSCMCVFATETTETEVAPSNQHAYAVNILNVLGVLTDDEVVSFDETSNVTRAEFVRLVLKMIGYSDELTVSEESLKFSDVPFTYWATPYIVYASDMGLISGYENGEFGPEDWLTYGQAVKIVLSAIGHTKENSKLTDYPDSYIALASLLGLLQNVGGNANNPIAKGDVAELIYNALEAEVVQQRSFGEEEFYVKDGVLMMEHYLDVKKVKGIWNADENKNVYGGTFPKAGTIEIDRMPYYVGTVKRDETLLFKNVVCYVKLAADDDATILYMEQGKGNYLEIKTEDLAGSPSISAIPYYEGYSKTSAFIASDVNILLNGRYFKPKASVTSNDLKQPQTTLKLYDNDRDGEYEILQLVKAETAIIDKVDVNNEYLFFKYGKLVDGNDYIDASNARKEKKVNIKNTEGAVVDPKTLAAWDVLEMYRTVDSAYIEIIVSDQRIRGTVESITDDEYIINGASYHLSQDYLDAFSAGHAKAEVPSAGDSGNFYTSASGWIAGFVKGAGSEYLYAFMIGYDGDPTDVSPKARVKLFSEEGEMLTLELANRVTLDGVTGLDDEAFLKQIAANTYNHECVVKFGRNAEGKLNYLDTPERTSYDASNPNGVRFELHYDGPMNWTAGYELENTNLRMTPKTIVFSVPGDLNNEKEFKVIPNSKLPIDTERNVPVIFDLYDSNEVYRVGACIYYSDGAAVSEQFTSPFLIVNRVTKFANEDGEILKRIQGLQTVSLSAGQGYTTEMTYEEAEPGLLPELSTGMMLRYILNTKGKILSIQHWYTPDKNRPFSQWGHESDTTANRVTYGRVTVISQDDKMIVVDAGSQGYISFLPRAICWYDEAKNKVQACGFEEIRVGDIVALPATNSHPAITMIHRYR